MRGFMSFGGAKYDDELGKKHIFEYCYEVWLDNPSIEWGFELIPCLNQNARLNCVDGECETD
jgi:hypothetical protein